MSIAPVSDEQLSAWLDGELDGPEAQAIERALAADPALARRLARFEDDMLALSQAYTDPPLPRTNPFSSKQTRWPAVAAALLVGVLIGTGLIRTHQQDVSGPKQRMLQIADAAPVSLESAERILLHIDSSDGQRIERVLNTAEQLLQERARTGRPLKLEVVANARGLITLRRESPYANRIRDLQSRHENVSFKACGMAMAHFSLVEGEPVELLPEADRVPAALEEILERLKEGWTYVHG